MDTVWLSDGAAAARPTLAVLNEYDIGDSVALKAVVVKLETQGSIDAGSSLLTVADPAGYLVSDPIIVWRAGPLGADLVTTISSIAGAVLTLATAASSTTSRAPTGKRVAATVAITVRKPDGTTSAPAVSSSTTGVYEASFDPDAQGDHFYRALVTGAAKAAAEELFRVRERRVT